jgi:polygalacturonase
MLLSVNAIKWEQVDLSNPLPKDSNITLTDGFVKGTGGIQFNGIPPDTTNGVLYSDSGTLMYGDVPVISNGVDTVLIYQNGSKITAKSYDGYIISTGIVGTDDLTVLSDARDFCHTYYPVGATIVILNGNYKISTFEFLYSNLTLKLKKGVTVGGETTLSSYPVREYGFPSYTKNYVDRSMFWAQDVSNVGIIGEGEIDGNGEHANFNTSEMLTRPFIIRFCNVSNFRVGGEDEYLKLYNSAMWTQHYLNCSSGIISKQLINTNKYGPKKEYRYANLDGLDIDCCDKISVSELDIISGDDALVPKASGPKNCTNITISNCALSSHRAGLKFGTETNGGFQNIAVSNINIFDSETGFGITTVDGGYSYNININNVNMYWVNTPFFVRLGTRNRPYETGGSVTTQSSMRNIVLDNILVTNPTSVAYTSYISGYSSEVDGRIKALSVSNFKIANAPGGGTVEDCLIKPEELPANYPTEQMFGKLPAYGLYVRHVSESNFEYLMFNSVLTNEDRPSLVFSDVYASRLLGVNTQKGENSIGRVFLNASKRLHISAVSGSFGVMFRINGSETDDVLLIGNDCNGTLSTLGAEVTPAEVRAAHNPD